MRSGPRATVTIASSAPTSPSSDHAQVEAGPPARRQQRRHARLVRANADAIAGHAGLGHFEQRAAYAVAVADADFVVGQPLDGEVLAELPVREIAAAQLLLPVPVRLGLVDEDSALLAPVAAKIALPVTFDVERLTRRRSCTGAFQMPVCTVLPRHSMSRGSPTQREINRAMDADDTTPRGSCRWDDGVALPSSTRLLRGCRAGDTIVQWKPRLRSDVIGPVPSRYRWR
jgi:hypothetical protein